MSVQDKEATMRYEADQASGNEAGADSSSNRYAVVANDMGVVIRGTATNIMVGGIGIYNVIFPTDVNMWVWTAAIGSSDATVATPGFVTVQQPPGGPAKVVAVRTYNALGNAEARPFHLLVTKP